MIKCALIGIGHWGSKLKRYIEENEDFALKYICNSKSDLNEVWNDSEVTAVVIATPNETHYSIARVALNNKKNVFCEKPLALTATQCEKLKRTALSRNRVLAIEYTYTFSRALQKAQEIINRGEIGNILGIEMEVRHLGRFKGGSVYWLLGSHMLSVLDMFTPIKSLSFQKTDIVTYEGEMETGAILFNGNGLSGQIVVSLNYPGKETRIIIYGEKGTIIYNPILQPSLQVEKYERLEWTVDSKLPRSHTDYEIGECHNLAYAFEYFAEVLRGKAKSNIDRAIAITRVLEELQK